MCGRFSNGLELDDFRQAVQEQLPEGYSADLGPDADQYNRSYNVAPQTRSLVLRAVGGQQDARADADAEKDGVRLVLQSMKWGLVPRSTKTPPKGPDAYRTINARDDTVLSGSGLWAPLFKRSSHRCVVLVQGFYEWQKRGPESKPERIAHFVGMSDLGRGRPNSAEGREYRLMPLAGLWERVRYEGESEDLYTFTIITTSSNSQLDFLHDRMPVILPDAASIALWLGLPGASAVKKEEEEEEEEEEGAQVAAGSGKEAPLSEVARLLKPFDRGQLQCYRVPPEVGKVGNSDPKFILPITERKDGIMAAFGRAKAKTEASTSSHGSVASKAAKSANVKQEDRGEAKVKDEVSASQDTTSETHAPLPSQSSASSSEASKPGLEPVGHKRKPTEPASTPSKKPKTQDGAKASPSSKSKMGGAGSTPPAASPQRASKTKGSQTSGGSRDIRSFFS